MLLPHLINIQYLVLYSILVTNIPSPLNVNASVWQTPVATIRTRTSPAFGGATSTSSIPISNISRLQNSTTLSILKGLPASQATAALHVIVLIRN